MVGVQPSEAEPTHAAELAALLREHLELAGLTPQDDAPLRELVDRAIERSGYT